MRPAVALALAIHAVNGEGPQWDAALGCLWFVDMRLPALHRFRPADGEHHCWRMPAWVGCFGLIADGTLALALRTGLFRFEPDSGALSQLAPAPYDPRRTCFNDGGCDRQGRLIAGPMDHPLGPDDARDVQPMPLWCYDGAGAMLPLPLPPVTIANGLAFSPDGRLMYHSDTPKKTVWVADYDPATGAVENQREFVRVEECGDDGGPDGATVDSEGFYICAVFGASCLLRYDPCGRLERRIELPARYPTMPALGGPNLATLYVTSASFPVKDLQSAEHRFDGGLMSLEAPAPGLPAAAMPPPKEPGA